MSDFVFITVILLYFSCKLSHWMSLCTVQCPDVVNLSYQQTVTLPIIKAIITFPTHDTHQITMFWTWSEIAWCRFERNRVLMTDNYWFYINKNLKK